MPEIDESLRQPGSVDGRWEIVLALVEPGNYATTEVAVTPTGGTEPEWYESETCLRFIYANGCIVVYPWSSVLSATYTPPVRPPR